MQIAIPSKARPFRSKTKDLLTCGIMYVPESEVQEYQLRGYVLASCMGIINDGTLYFDEAFRVKEDYEISLRHVQQFGGIVRAEYMYFENEHWTGDGGCKDYRTDELERDCINRLIQLYPRFIRNVSNKSSQYTIKLHFD